MSKVTGTKSLENIGSGSNYAITTQILSINSYSTSSTNIMMTALAPQAPIPATESIYYGVALTNNNCGVLGFQYNGLNSSTNYAFLSVYGSSAQLRINGAGAITVPSQMTLSTGGGSSGIVFSDGCQIFTTGTNNRDLKFAAYGGSGMTINQTSGICTFTAEIQAPLVKFTNNANPIYMYAGVGNSAYNFVLPTTAGTAGQVLTSGGGGTCTWSTVTGVGTVTSVGVTVPSFMSVTGSPITAAGTIAISATSTGTGSVVLQTAPTITTPVTLTGSDQFNSLKVISTSSAANNLISQFMMPNLAAGATCEIHIGKALSASNAGTICFTDGGKFGFGTYLNNNIFQIQNNFGDCVITGTYTGSQDLFSVFSAASSAVRIRFGSAGSTLNCGVMGYDYLGAGNTGNSIFMQTFGAGTAFKIYNDRVQHYAGQYIQMGGSTSGYTNIKVAAAAGNYDFILPTTAGTVGQLLTSNAGGTMTWTTVGGTGTVTSVAMTVPSFMSVTGSPITTSGTFAISASSTGTGSVVLSSQPLISASSNSILSPVFTTNNTYTGTGTLPIRSSFAPNLTAGASSNIIDLFGKDTLLFNFLASSFHYVGNSSSSNFYRMCVGMTYGGSGSDFELQMFPHVLTFQNNSVVTETVISKSLRPNAPLLSYTNNYIGVAETTNNAAVTGFYYGAAGSATLNNWYVNFTGNANRLKYYTSGTLEVPGTLVVNKNNIGSNYDQIQMYPTSGHGQCSITYNFTPGGGGGLWSAGTQLGGTDHFGFYCSTLNKTYLRIEHNTGYVGIPTGSAFIMDNGCAVASTGTNSRDLYLTSWGGIGITVSGQGALNAGYGDTSIGNATNGANLRIYGRTTFKYSGPYMESGSTNNFDINTGNAGSSGDIGKKILIKAGYQDGFPRDGGLYLNAQDSLTQTLNYGTTNVGHPYQGNCLFVGANQELYTTGSVSANGIVNICETNSNSQFLTVYSGSFVGFYGAHMPNTPIGSCTKVTGSTVNWNTSSDYRLKTNVNNMPSMVEKICSLRPICYTDKYDEQAGTLHGFLAHEVQDKFPLGLVIGDVNGVDENNQPKYQQMDYAKFTPMLVKCIQELTQRICILEGTTPPPMNEIIDPLLSL